MSNMAKKKSSKKKPESVQTHKCKSEEKNPFVAIAASLGGIYLAVVMVVLIFAESAAETLVPIAWAFVALGFFSMLFTYKAEGRE